MPIFEYRCDAGHKFERLYKTFAEAEAAPTETCCDVCHFRIAEKVEFSVPSQAQLFGNPDGYHKPSSQKRYSTKLINQSGNAKAQGG